MAPIARHRRHTPHTTIVEQRVGRLHALLPDIPRASFAKAAAKAPRMCQQTPERILLNVSASAALLEVPPLTFTTWAVKSPMLFGLTRRRVLRTIRFFENELEYPREDTLSLLRKRPQTMLYSTDNIRTAARGLHAWLGPRAARIILTCPQLLTHSLKTLKANAAAAAAVLGIPEPLFLDAAARQPQILYMRPATLHANARESARLIGLPLPSFVHIATLYPSAFFAAPRKLARNVRLISYIAHYLNHDLDLARFLARNTGALGYSRRRLLARALIARARLAAMSPGRLIAIPARDADAMIVRHLETTLGRKSAAAIRRYVAAGLISSRCL